MTLPRVVEAEVLDHLAVDDPAAQRSRRDLARVHRAMGTRAIVRRGWQELLAARHDSGSTAPLRVLELGAGDGTLLLGVARGGGWGPVELTLLDRQDTVAPATLAAYASAGWTARVEQVDVTDWAVRPLPGRWDLISTALFLHHFERPALSALLQAVAQRTSRFFACEPRRGWLALAGSHLVGAIGANAVTRNDAVLSVHAGFRGDELAASWSAANDNGNGNGNGTSPWRTREYAAGLFSHCFSAAR